MRSLGRVSPLVRPFSLCLLLALGSPVVADPGNHQTKIICRQEFSISRREELTGKLRSITGWSDLAFDKNGSLQLGTNPPHGGSETARRLLTEAISGPNVLILEDASKRKDVMFCKVVSAYSKRTALQNPSIYVVLIDFTDFDYLIGDRSALQALNAGWGFLHEIDHVVNDSIDSNNLGTIGDCEDHINQMRRELDLPERSEYFSTYFPYIQDTEFTTRFVRLPFDRKDAASGKLRRYWLMWDATLVGGLNGVKQTAQYRPRH